MTEERRILLVDDDPTVLQGLKMRFALELPAAIRDIDVAGRADE